MPESAFFRNWMGKHFPELCQGPAHWWYGYSLIDNWQNLVNSQTNNAGFTPLTLAAGSNNLTVCEHLLDNDANIEAKDTNGCTALRSAAYNGRKETVELLLAKGAKIEAKENDGRTALHLAAGNGHKETVERLLAKANIEAKNKYGNTALHLAADKGHKETVELLLAKGAKIEAESKYGKTALHLAADKGHKETVELLLAKGAKIKAESKYGKTALHLAAINGHKETVELLLAKANIEAKNKYGNTALHLAADKGHKETVRLLLAKANIEAKNKYGNTALHLAAINGRKETVGLLLAKASIEAKDNDGRTALHLAALNGRKETVGLLLVAKANIEAKDTNGCTALHLAVDKGHKETVKLLLAKANIEAKNKYGNTALHLAAGKGHKETVELLLAKGAKIEAESKYGNTALHFAALNGHKENVELLLAKGAKIEAENKYGLTALHHAAANGHKETVEPLLAKGAKIEVRDKYGRTALCMAAINGHKATVELLLAKEKIEAKDRCDRMALHLAAAKGDKETVELLLVKGAKIEAKDNGGNTALHLAAAKGHKETVELLLAKGAKIEAKDKYGNTALHLAAANWFAAGQKETVELLLAKGAKIEAKDKYGGNTALHYAARVRGGKEIIKLLLDENAEIEAKDNDGNTALHMAAFNRDKETVELLLAKANIEAKDNDGNTALHKAAKSWHSEAEAVELLLVAKANIEAKDTNGCTALHLAADKGHKETVKLLLAKANIEAKNKYGNTALHLAAINGRKETVELLLAKANIEAKDTNGRTALHLAATNRRNKTVELLLAKANIEAKDNNGWTALHWAVAQCSGEIVKILLENKEVDINAKNNKGETALDIAKDVGYKAIIEAIIKHQVEKSKVPSFFKLFATNHFPDDAGKLCNKPNLKCTTEDNGLQPIHVAVKNNNEDILKFLIKEKADINAKDNNGWTALHWAAAKVNEEIVKILLKNKEVDINAKNNKGETALSIAKKARCKVEIIKSLQEAIFKKWTVEHFPNNSNELCANTNLNCRKGHRWLTPLFCAIDTENEEIVEFLITKKGVAREIILNDNSKLNALKFANTKKDKSIINIIANFEKQIAQQNFSAWLTRKDFNNSSDKNDNGEYPIHVAAEEGCLEHIECLLENGVYIDKKTTNDYKKTALHIASMEGNRKLIEFLAYKKASFNEKDGFGRTVLDLAKNDDIESYLKQLEEKDSYDYLGKIPKILKTELEDLVNIGSGGYGNVQKGRWKNNDVAFKSVINENFTIKNLKNEINIMSKLRSHGNIVQLKCICVDDSKEPIGIVMEYIISSLRGFLDGYKEKFVHPNDLYGIGRDIGYGVSYLHEMGFLHRDLKSPNILLTENMQAKICDFGISISITEKQEGGIVGTTRWLAPEVLEGKPHSKKSDIYSYGVILWELLTKRVPYEEYKKIDDIKNGIKNEEYLKELKKSSCELALITESSNSNLTKGKLYLKLDLENKKLDYKIRLHNTIIKESILCEKFEIPPTANYLEEFNNMKETILEILFKKGHAPSGYCPQKFKKIIIGCLDYKPNNRVEVEATAKKLDEIFIRRRDSFRLYRTSNTSDIKNNSTVTQSNQRGRLTYELNRET